MFPSLSFPGIVPADTVEERSTTFHTSLILCCLSTCKNYQQAQTIATKGVSFLLSEKSPAWSFNYWKKNSLEHASVRCPDDLDDSAAALAAIELWEPGRIDGTAMAAIVGNYITAETTPGGPYNTWIVRDFVGTSWEDTDIAVNAQSAYFLGQKNITLAGLHAYIDDAIVRNKYISKYYKKLPIIYLIARSYRGKHAGRLMRALAAHNTPSLSALERAIWTSAFIRLGGDPSAARKEIGILVRTQEKDGGWPARAFFTEQVKDGIPWQSGSRALTAAFCLEAISLYEEAVLRRDAEKKLRKTERQCERLLGEARQRFSSSSSLIRRQFSGVAERVASKSAWTEIALLPKYFNDALEKKRRVSKKHVDTLSKANILGWIGYTICDKILDGEDVRGLLPMANICLREVTSMFELLPVDRQGHKEIRNVLDAIESANAWEYETCRMKTENGAYVVPEHIPEYPRCTLAKKSLGHALGPMSVMLLSNSKGDARLVRRFFEHYLTARQLDDDAHDWLDDLENGFLNSASVHILRESKLNAVTLPKDKEMLREIFWDSVIDRVAAKMLSHVRSARTLLKRMSFLSDPSYLARLLAPIEQSARNAIKERNETRALMAASDFSEFSKKASPSKK